MTRRTLVFIACVMVAICSGCGGSKQVALVLPTSHGPLAVDKEIIVKVKEVEEIRPALRGPGQFGVPEIRAIARKTRLAPVAVAKCDVKVIRIFLASDWSPLVILGPPAGPRRLWAVVGYDDSKEEFILVDSLDYSEQRMQYPIFLRSWAGQQKTCLLIFSRFVGEERIRRALMDYLPEERAESIPIWTPRVR